ncbi:HAD family hydrolase [Sphingomonas sp. CROZ-RG-20F-R02-07]|uniref:HAD family hydrolase n=1 Tax=Sphingomonas sp. CROZ-RG-20F-R02-07 TaxID=2914832 RepID=UPI001F58AD15|nr:HAD family hydrolase [Sphingomonas sp. CROZ-RG-20F-R02-07]
MPTTRAIRATDIAGVLDALPAGVTTISLDCFDTLIWRATHAAVDVFAGIDLPGGAMGPRMWSEGSARQIAAQRGGTGNSGAVEIRLADVYRHLHIDAAPERIEAAVAHELGEEARHAFAFAPMVALIREAHARGLRVVIVSDMYLSEAELRRHIAGAAGDDVLALIAHVFVSADHGSGKCDTLFDHVLETLDADPATILHIGDNPAADLKAAAAHGLHAVHLLQFDAASETRLRHEAIAATMIDPAARVTRPVLQPHRAAVSLRACDEPAYRLGHDVIGPAMHGFALWVKAEVDAMTARLGRPVRPLFMMRDGHLPLQAFETLFPDAGAVGVEISRFVAGRAAMFDPDSLERYLGDWLPRLPVQALARQMMLTPDDWGKIAKIPNRAAQEAAFVRLIGKPEMRRKILRRTDTFATKLCAHLAAAGVTPGDAVMLVDLGYNGTVQNLVTPMLQHRLGLTVAGRYLFLREGQMSGLDKRGMLDTRRYEARTLHALTSSVALLEQLCNVAQGSTVDFTADGTPVREKPDMKAEHSAVRDAVQAACIDYVRTCKAGIQAPAASDDLDARVQAAAAALARLFFLPSADEAALFATFNFDTNMGTNACKPLFDTQGAERGLRRLGLPYLNQGNGMYVPGEIQPKGLPLALTLFASARFSMDLRTTDFDTGGVAIPVILLGDGGEGIVERTAYPTIDGYYRIDVPVGAGRFVPGIQFGHVCEWLQIEEVLYRPVAADDTTTPRAAAHVTDAMEAMAPGLYRASPQGLLMAPPPPSTTPQMLTVVFRPIQWRGAAAEVARAA